MFWYDPAEKTMLCGDEALKNPGIDKAVEAIAASKQFATQNNCAIIGSLTGSSIEEITYVARRLEEAGCSALEINMICPATGPHLGEHYANLGKYWVETTERAVRVIKAIKDVVNIPVWPKVVLEKLVSPEFLRELDSKTRPDAYSYVGGRMPVLTIDTSTGRPRFAGNTLLQIEKGMPIMPIVTGPSIGSTILHTAYLARLTKTPLVCAGGVQNADHVLQCIMAGAAAVQICTVVFKNKNIAEPILQGLQAHVEEKGLDSISEIRGVSLQYIPQPPLLRVPPVSIG